MTGILGVGPHKPTDASIDKVAQALAEAMNGGLWDMDYTEAQREVWRRAVRSLFGMEDDVQVGIDIGKAYRKAKPCWIEPDDDAWKERAESNEP